MKAAHLLLAALVPFGCAPAHEADTAADSGAGPADSAGPDDPDGDGYVDADDCRDEDATIHPGAVEDCGNGEDDDCDGHTDGGDTACPLEGEVEASDADVNLNEVGLWDVRPHPLPTDGTSALWAPGTATVDWYDFYDAMAGTWTLLASARGTTESLESLADLEGDGQTDFVVQGEAGVLRFAGLPGELTSGEATLVVSGSGLLGVGADVDADGIADLVVQYPDAETGMPVVAWVSPTMTGELDAATRSLSSLPVAPGSTCCYHVSDISRVQAFDADGDGTSETVLTKPGETDSYGAEWYQRGAVYMVSGAPAASSLEEASSAIVREDGWEVGVYDAAGVGDLDGDGYADLAVGYSGGNGEEGLVLLLPGPFGGAHGRADASASISGLAVQTGFSSGDMDADGVPELLVSARRGDEEYGVFVFSDPAAGGSADAAHLAFLEAGDFPELREATLHDINADGLDDILGTLVFYAR